MEPRNIRTYDAAELLINNKGKIYHLNLAPEHIADTVITVGDPNRVPLVSGYFDSILHKSQHREFVAHYGRLGKKNVLVISTGIGPDNVDIVMNELDALANIDFTTRTPMPQHRKLSIIRLGTCGALQADIPVDSFILSSYGIGLDNLLHYYHYENNAEERFIMQDFMQHTRITDSKIQPYIAEGAIALRRQFASTGFIDGITVTCPGFYAPQGRFLRSRGAYPYLLDALNTFNSRDLKATNFEMETAALYGLGKVLGHNCLSLSTVLNNRVTNAVSANMQGAVEQMIKYALATVEQM